MIIDLERGAAPCLHCTASASPPEERGPACCQWGGSRHPAPPLRSRKSQELAAPPPGRPPQAPLPGRMLAALVALRCRQAGQLLHRDAVDLQLHVRLVLRLNLLRLVPQLVAPRHAHRGWMLGEAPPAAAAAAKPCKSSRGKVGARCCLDRNRGGKERLFSPGPAQSTRHAAERRVGASTQQAPPLQAPAAHQSPLRHPLLLHSHPPAASPLCCDCGCWAHEYGAVPGRRHCAWPRAVGRVWFAAGRGCGARWRAAGP